MILFRAMSAEEFNKLTSGETISSDKKFSIYFRKTTSFGLCFYPVSTVVDEEIIIHDSDNSVRYMDIGRVLELTGNYDSYDYGVYFEVDRDNVEQRHGTYQSNDGSNFTVSEFCTRSYNKNDFKIKRVIQLKI